MPLITDTLVHEEIFPQIRFS